MKTYEILPTDKNLVQTLIDDTIGRDSDVFRFVNILNSIDCSYSVALDGRWGKWKDFFRETSKTGARCQQWALGRYGCRRSQKSSYIMPEIYTCEQRAAAAGMCIL